MKFGVLGSGDVGKVLAAGFLKHGHEVMIGTRTAAKLAQWHRENPKGRVGSFAEAAAFGEVVVLAVKGGVATDALRAAGSGALEDMGGVEAARAIEPLCILWCIPGFLRNQWTHAFKLLK